MKAILINALARTITEVPFNGKFQGTNGAYGHVGCEMLEAPVINHKTGDSCLVDEEGLLSNDEKHFFLIEGAYQPFCGNGLVVGSNAKGDFVQPKLTLAQVQAKVTFMDATGAYLWAKKHGV